MGKTTGDLGGVRQTRPCMWLDTFGFFVDVAIVRQRTLMSPGAHHFFCKLEGCCFSGEVMAGGDT